MTDRTLGKISIVPDADQHGYRLVLSWMTGGSGRRAEILPDLFATSEEAGARAVADYGLEAEAGDPSTSRRP